jgi:hypothetical protein
MQMPPRSATPSLARLRALRSDLIDPTTAVHNGRVVKRTGDGILIEFRSVVDALRCAIEVQNGMVERNTGLPPERRIEFRIGIHLGDVVEESDGDLMGDGVNIAARLRSSSAPASRLYPTISAAKIAASFRVSRHHGLFAQRQISTITRSELAVCGNSEAPATACAMSPPGPQRYFAAPNNNVAIGVTTDIDRHGY